MFPDLPEHLQTLNTIPGNTPPSHNVMNQEQEEAFWGFLHADELFRNFGNPPSPNEHVDKAKYAAAATATATPSTSHLPITTTPITEPRDNKQTTGNTPTLESFIAAFIGQSSSNNANINTIANSTNALPTNYLVPLPTPNPYIQTAPTSPKLGPTSIPTSDLFPSSASTFDFDDESDDRISGAKRLKQLGAPLVEIEEDKRRRNTEASARFRAKKKEREQALERRAKELEAQVASLAAENSSLENENRLLKAIVLNSGSAAGLPNGSGNVSANESLQAAMAAFGGAAKRKRED